MYKFYKTGFRNPNLTLKEKLYNLNLTYFFFIFMLASIGVLMLYSAANGNWHVWALKHAVRFALSVTVMLVLTLTDIKVFLHYAYYFYLISLFLLIVVEVAGHKGMGATRWINLGFMKLQPSELMKIALVLALAKYFHSTTLQNIETIPGIVPPLLMALVPAALIMLQPDLGTALMLLFTTGVILFVVGVQLWKFVAVGVGALAMMPIAWHFLHDYQRQRVLTFLNPERDPLGAGYHIMQSKIALGSGGVFGKGFLNGTQSHLNFLPEKHTDFIFTMLSEEFGIIGALLVVVLNLLILLYSYSFAFKTTSYFGKLVIIGLSTNYFLYIFINISMVLGMIPVVGVPLPMISYGGTVMLSVLASFGIVMAMYVNRNTNLGKD
uniref:Peptidoglycan glycosyltransferase MrdB n=1 Tax=uncultured Alphaproteobacteria bacterium TaxID=91750 RepID=A0A6M4NMV7_9PROT|nr:rod shape-determining protein RodA [uncultured Alphaproteobacteria bacterium]